MNKKKKQAKKTNDKSCVSLLISFPSSILDVYFKDEETVSQSVSHSPHTSPISSLPLHLLELLVGGSAQGSHNVRFKVLGGLVVSETLVGQAVDEHEL